jgi:hypothetical protein
MSEDKPELPVDESIAEAPILFVEEPADVDNPVEVKPEEESLPDEATSELEEGEEESSPETASESEEAPPEEATPAIPQNWSRREPKESWGELFSRWYNSLSDGLGTLFASRFMVLIFCALILSILIGLDFASGRWGLAIAHLSLVALVLRCIYLMYASAKKKRTKKLAKKEAAERAGEEYDEEDDDEDELLSRFTVQKG